MFPQPICNKAQWMDGFVCERSFDNTLSDGLDSNFLLFASEEKKTITKL